TEDPSAVNDQRSVIDHPFRMSAQQSRKYDSLKAAMDRNENLDIAGNSPNGYLPATPILDAAMIPT
ncbi:MAG: hypothetical protein ASARMPRED_002460, partial [Alectoria sarmentosa]